jgi:ferredoxin
MDLFFDPVPELHNPFNPRKCLMAITKVWLDESENECTMCGACEAVESSVFSVPEKMTIKKNADFAKYEAGIKEAADGCPVATIAYEIDGSGKRDN